jgi:hypothetical protein
MTVAARAIRIPSKRLSWSIIGLGLWLYGLGNVVWSAWIEHLKVVPIPSVCDRLWLSLYPLAYGGIVTLAWSRGRRRVPAGVWLDGIHYRRRGPRRRWGSLRLSARFRLDYRQPGGDQHGVGLSGRRLAPRRARARHAGASRLATRSDLGTAGRRFYDPRGRRLPIRAANRRWGKHSHGEPTSATSPLSRCWRSRPGSRTAKRPRAASRAGRC